MTYIEIYLNAGTRLLLRDASQCLSHFSFLEQTDTGCSEKHCETVCIFFPRFIFLGLNFFRVKSRPHFCGTVDGVDDRR